MRIRNISEKLVSPSFPPNLTTNYSHRISNWWFVFVQAGQIPNPNHPKRVSFPQAIPWKIPRLLSSIQVALEFNLTGFTTWSAWGTLFRIGK